MGKSRRKHSADFKFRIALEAAKEQKTLTQLASEHNLHPNQIGSWKRELLEKGKEVFKSNGSKELRALAQRETALYEQIGRLKMELEWVKKKAAPFSG